MKIRIASRESRLAMWQAEHVKDRLLGLPGVTEVEIIGMTTQGDQILDRSLSKIGGKGLFIKELEVALLEGRADLAVHSGKDIPMELDADFELVGFMTREDPRDAFVSNHYSSLAQLPAGAVVGSSSLRRQAQILARYPHLVVQPLRGNLDTRLRKLDNGEYAAIVLAAAGLKRLGLTQRIRAVIEVTDMLPAVAQGALGLEIMAGRDDLKAILQPLIDPSTTLIASAEREVSRALGGSCQVPIGGYARIDDEGQMLLNGMVATTDGQTVLQASASRPASDWKALAHEVVSSLKAQGALSLLNQQA
ncbi:MAG: hydroxymethylbilane synthase [Limnobacter sp.]|uniref:hydroxymethylbilane synthase n=1 Tax=Limnobacter sp. TaxID=2003368 RepID=UPI0039194966